MRVDSGRGDGDAEFEKAVGRCGGWLERRGRGEVEQLVMLRNTDLRAGDEWLVFVTPAVRKKMGRTM